jgi:hypothetical protein
MNGGNRMDMIEKYLEAIAAQLPAAERADIIAELRDLILNRFEARERELGRAISDMEKETILRDIGHPLVVAARYRKGPDSLVGPLLFPYWLFAVKAGLIIIAALCMLGLILDFLSGHWNIDRAIGHALTSFLSGGLTLIGAATLAAAIFEHFGIRPHFLTHWRVSDLGAFTLSDPMNWRKFFRKHMG